MKKRFTNLIKLTIIINLIITIIMPFTISNASTSKNFDKYIVSDGTKSSALFKKDNSTELNEVYMSPGKYSDYDAEVKNGGKSTEKVVYYNWLRGTDYIINNIKPEKYSDYTSAIYDGSEALGLAKAISGLKKARKEIGSFIGGENDVSDGNTQVNWEIFFFKVFDIGDGDSGNEVLSHPIRSRQAFVDITGVKLPEFASANEYQYDAVADEVNKCFSEYDQKICKAIRILHAALDSKQGFSSYNKSTNGNYIYVEDNYETKFKYNATKVKAYDMYYSMDIMGDKCGLSKDQKETLKKCWYAKVAAATESDLEKYKYAGTADDMYIDKKDSENKKLQYSPAEMWLYIQVFGFDNSEPTSVRMKWANRLCNKNYNEENPSVDERVDALKDLQGIENVVDKGKQIVEESTRKVNNFSSNYKQDAEGSSGAAITKDNNTYYHPINTGSRNTQLDPDEAMNKADEFIEKGESNVIKTDQMKNVFNSVYSTALAFGALIVIIMGAVIGFKYLTGSVEEKAETKKMFIPYLAGTIAIFGAFAIWKFVIEILSGM